MHVLTDGGSGHGDPPFYSLSFGCIGCDMLAATQLPVSTGL